MNFKNRKSAGLNLVKKLSHYKNEEAVILAIPRPSARNCIIQKNKSSNF